VLVPDTISKMHQITNFAVSLTNTLKSAK